MLASSSLPLRFFFSFFLFPVHSFLFVIMSARGEEEEEEEEEEGRWIGLNFHFFWFRIFHDGLRQHKSSFCLGRGAVRLAADPSQRNELRRRRWCRVIEIQEKRERKTLCSSSRGGKKSILDDGWNKVYFLSPSSYIYIQPSFSLVWLGYLFKAIALDSPMERDAKRAAAAAAPSLSDSLLWVSSIDRSLGSFAFLFLV